VISFTETRLGHIDFNARTAAPGAVTMKMISSTQYNGPPAAVMLISESEV